MKNRIILISSLLLCLNSFGQFRSSPNRPAQSSIAPLKAFYISDWSLGIALKSSAEHIIIKNLDPAIANQFDYRPKFSYEVELFIEKKFNSNWIRVSGINFHGFSSEYNHILPVSFSKIGNPTVDGRFLNEYNLTIENSFEEINFNAIAEFTMFDDGNDYEDKEELKFRVSSVNKIQSLGIPIALKRIFSNNRLSFTSKIGFEPTIILNKKIHYNYYHQSGFYIEGDRPNYKFRKEESSRLELVEVDIISQTNKLKKLQLFAFLNIGLVHTYNYHSFFLEAEYKRGLSILSQKNASTSYLHSFGFRTGFIKRFRLEKPLDKPIPNPNLNW